MNPGLFAMLLQHYPKGQYPCDEKLFENQCAIRMGVALEKAYVSTADFTVRRCSKAFPKLKLHAPGHILAAQELANALAQNPARLSPGMNTLKLLGSINSNLSQLGGKSGVIFIQNGWGPTDHIDLWNGTGLIGGGVDTSGNQTFLSKGVQIWFWRLM